MSTSLKFAAALPASGADPLSAVFQALADPTRRAMLRALAQGKRTLTELAAPLPMSLPAVTKHLRMLERAGLVSRSRQAQTRPCTLQVKPLKDAGEWIAQYRADWESRLDRLDAFVVALHEQQTAQAKAKARSKRPSRKSSPPTSR